MADPLRRDEENPYVGTGMHKNPRQAELHGRAERRALERSYGMPDQKSATKKRKRRKR